MTISHGKERMIIKKKEATNTFEQWSFFYLNIFYGLGFWPEHTYDSILAVRDKIQIVSSAAAGQNNLPTISLPICDHLRQLVAIFSHSFHHWIFFSFVPTSFSRGGSICQQMRRTRSVFLRGRCMLSNDALRHRTVNRLQQLGWFQQKGDER